MECWLLRIPKSFAYLEGRAFRHGDIVCHDEFSIAFAQWSILFPQEDTLGDLAKKAGGFALGALIGKGGSKFGGLDIKRVYFGWVLALWDEDLLWPFSQELASGL